MKIAQVSPLYESVPPCGYGGTERIVSYLTEELVRLGHDVTLFASGDSATSARLVPCSPRALRTDPQCRDQIAPHLLMLERVLQQASEFDLIHFHTGYLHFPLVRRQPVPHLSTVHGGLNLPEFASLHREFDDLPIVAISEAQRRMLPTLSWRGTVHHGLPSDRYRLQPEPGAYLAFVGRVSPEKGVHDAIAIARAAGVPLRIAAKIETADRDYYEAVAKPLLDDPLVEFVGEIGDQEKQAFLGGAFALLFPIRWPEPFGIVMIEAMACGTPVVAFRAGSVPEVIEDGVSGFIVDDVDAAVRVLPAVATLDRARCREAFDRRFTARRMAQDYVALYEAVLAGIPPAPAARAIALPEGPNTAPSSAVAGM